MDNKQLVLNTLIKAGKPLKSGEISDLSGLGKKDINKEGNYGNVDSDSYYRLFLLQRRH